MARVRLLVRVPVGALPLVRAGAVLVAVAWVALLVAVASGDPELGAGALAAGAGGAWAMISGVSGSR